MPTSKKPSSRHQTPPAEGGTHSPTRTKLLDAAEDLLAKRGADGVSVRQITEAARANLGAVNYHFGGKEQLMMAVFSRRLKEVNSARIARLDTLEQKAGKRPLKIRDIMDAFIRPAMEGPDGGVGHSEAMVRLLSRMHCEPTPTLKKYVEEQFEEIVYRFDASMMRSIKGFTPTDVYWRMVYLVGALNLGQDVWLRFANRAHPGHMTPEGTTDLHRPGRETFIREIVDFFTGGFASSRAKAKSSGTKRKRVRRK